jgi:uroporphyrinogen decarboxylase
MPEYRAIRQNFPSILEMVRQPEVAAEITLQPMKAFELDAAIIFSDILVVLESMGLEVEFVSGEGPVIRNPVRSAEDVEKLRVRPPKESLGYTLDAIRLAKKALKDKPLIGFAGAPFTLACYAIEGAASRDFATAKAFMFSEPEAWMRLMEKLASVIGAFLRDQAEAGADAVQLFDSWAGVLSPMDFSERSLPYIRKLVDRTRAAAKVPVIYFSTGTTAYSSLLRQTGADVLGIDWRASLDAIWAQLGEDVVLQGNLDPTVLLAPPKIIEERAVAVLNRAAGRPGHIFNLGHGILERTPVDSVRRLVDCVHENSAR